MRRGKRLVAAAATALLAAGAFGLAGCRPAPPPNKPKAAEVVATTPITDTVTDYQDFTGRLEAVTSIDIRARVSGYVNEVPFKEGDLVKEGDLLFQIDPRTYKADYNLAVASYNQAVAEQDLQQKNIVRMRKLVGTGAVTQEEVDQVEGALEKAKAAVGAAIASRDRAKLYLDYTKVISPVGGRISRRYVDPGNLVNADNTVLTSIVTEDPMWAYFDVDERTYLDLVEAGNLAGAKYPVWMRLANESDYVHGGHVDFVDNKLNGNSGTIRLRGVFENPKHNLKSGLFVRIRLPIGQAYKATLIPDEAIMSDQDRKYVYVVGSDNKAGYQQVFTGQSIGLLRVIKKGLKTGDRVVVSGMQRIKPDAEVEVKMQAPPKPPSAEGKRLTYDLPAKRGGDTAAAAN
ncbi:MAG TPA: efflux RND transporter periplasmic adaptor subunit [Gemmataceae bacterium]|nr:efflux RND transporter periplasmic adaptor subunit [Gemmataceae bacterium]